MERIVIATDGSTAAREAVELGLELAAEDGARVTFVHVLPPRDWFVAVLGVLPAGSAADEGDGAREDPALREAAELAAGRGVEADLAARSGFPENEIVRVADEVDADLIVVGSRGLGAFGRALLGSVSGAVLRRSSRPVLVVRGARRAQAAAA